MDTHLVCLKNVLKGLVDKKELLNKYNAVVLYDNLPDKLNGYAFIYRDIYNIHINNRLDRNIQDHTIMHELAHIEMNIYQTKVKYGFKCFIEGQYDEAEEYLKQLRM